MVIIRIQGGLGNQLFQYALYETFRKKGITAKVDISAYEEGREKREFELMKLDLHPEVCTRQELHCYYADNTLLTDRIFRYVFGRAKYRKEKMYDFNPQILYVTDGFLSGYWQSERYFLPVAHELRDKIHFRNIDEEVISRWEKQMRETNSVSVHIRLGDYLQVSELYGSICTKRYYQEAIRYIAERVENPVFYIFSDDPDQAVDMLSEYPCRVVTENRGTDSYKDMYLMSKCRYHIIANSTFSWWGAWLDDREDKMVITPEKWNNLCKAHDICCTGWIIV